MMAERLESEAKSSSKTVTTAFPRNRAAGQEAQASFRAQKRSQKNVAAKDLLAQAEDALSKDEEAKAKFIEDAIEYLQQRKEEEEAELSSP